jgi:hypothetical protein
MRCLLAMPVTWWMAALNALLAQLLILLPPFHPQVGEAAGVRDEALRTVDRLRARLRRVAGEAAVAAAAVPSRPRVLVLQSLRPLLAAGWWVTDQVTLAGGACWPGMQPGDAPTELTWDQVRLVGSQMPVSRPAGGSASLLEGCPAASVCASAHVRSSSEHAAGCLILAHAVSAHALPTRLRSAPRSRPLHPMCWS